ncbi:hypothetical protein RJ640_019912 [Escallonia rubra]|uniref:Uncharacterized protein n=1 Tax=Escallonia rubra TaxID=112253 RepID=A0AA88UVE8_9ASTE|nr:hypothetical protein RJ640_019912 [Escallonia rubra]
MSPKTLESRHAIESCTFQLHTWRPFHLIPTALKTLDSDSYAPYSNGVHAKKPCLSDRTTSFPIESLDMSKLSLFDDDRVLSTRNRRDSFSWIARKRRRRGSRSVSGRSSDRSGTRRRCCSVGASAAANATCSDFPVANGTDSSGELFLNGDANWASDVSEAARHGGGGGGGGNGERENISVVCGQIGNFDGQGNESGYGSEPGYRGDAEFGYGDEVDEEEDDPRLLFWANKFGDEDSNMEIIGENSVQKTHHRCRRKKHDLRMVHPCR